MAFHLSNCCANGTFLLRSLESLHKQEIAKNKLLKQELVNYQAMQQQASAAKQEAGELRKKLADLQSVQKVINGLSDVIYQMILCKVQLHLYFFLHISVGF